MCDAWVTDRDLCQLIQKCIDNENLKFAIFHGLSNNAFLRLDISDARELVGYAPQDDVFALNPKLAPFDFEHTVYTHSVDLPAPASATIFRTTKRTIEPRAAVLIAEKSRIAQDTGGENAGRPIAAAALLMLALPATADEKGDALVRGWIERIPDITPITAATTTTYTLGKRTAVKSAE